MTFKLMSRPCDQCLVTKNRIVSGERAREIVAKVRSQDGFFICHKSKPGRDNEICCRGVSDKVGPGQLHRIMGRIGAIVEIDPETLEPVEARPDAWPRIDPSVDAPRRILRRCDVGLWVDCAENWKE